MDTGTFFARTRVDSLTLSPRFALVSANRVLAIDFQGKLDQRADVTMPVFLFHAGGNRILSANRRQETICSESRNLQRHATRTRLRIYWIGWKVTKVKLDSYL